jgi:glycerol-3-phosphate dehydrogenase (NAD(P)+)
MNTTSETSGERVSLAVIGAGTWGSVLAHIAAPCADVALYSATGKNVQALQMDRRHPKLPGFILDPRVDVRSTMGEELREANAVILVVASRYIRDMARHIAPLISSKTVVCIAAKGLEQGSAKTLSEVVAEELPDADICVLSGGSHEVATNLPFGISLAGSSCARSVMKRVFAKARARISEQEDVKSLERFGAVKNLIAIAAGIAEGLALGDNFRACFLTDAIAEARRFVGASADDVLSYGALGDLLATALSVHSRNFTYGCWLGQGLSPEKALAEVGMVVEGLNVARVFDQFPRSDCPLLTRAANIAVHHEDLTRERFLSRLGY